jgi:hypothetical protein
MSADFGNLADGLLCENLCNLWTNYASSRDEIPRFAYEDIFSTREPAHFDRQKELAAFDRH